MRPVDILCLGLCLSLPALADERGAQASAAALPAHEVSALLELQRSGRLASPYRQTLPGDAQSRAWLRYLNSFTHPIPPRYIDDKFKTK